MSWAQEFSQGWGIGLSFSHGWLQGFLSRQRFVIRKATNKPFLSDEEVVGRAISFVLHFKALIDEYHVRPENIFSLDETALFFDHEKQGTIDVRGYHHVPVNIHE